MPVLTWSEEYSINVAEVDAQHKKLLEYVSELHAAVEARIDKEDLRQMLEDLVDFTRFHFSTEERLMNEHGLEHVEMHHNEHEMLLKHMEDLVEGVSNGIYPSFYSDYDISNDWFLSHILKFDKKLGEYLNSKGVY